MLPQTTSFMSFIAADKLLTESSPRCLPSLYGIDHITHSFYMNIKYCTNENIPQYLWFLWWFNWWIVKHVWFLIRSSVAIIPQPSVWFTKPSREDNIILRSLTEIDRNIVKLPLQSGLCLHNSFIEGIHFTSENIYSSCCKTDSFECNLRSPIIIVLQKPPVQGVLPGS